MRWWFNGLFGLVSHEDLVAVDNVALIEAMDLPLHLDDPVELFAFLFLCLAVVPT